MSDRVMVGSFILQVCLGRPTAQLDSGSGLRHVCAFELSVKSSTVPNGCARGSSAFSASDSLENPARGGVFHCGRTGNSGRRSVEDKSFPMPGVKRTAVERFHLRPGDLYRKKGGEGLLPRRKKRRSRTGQPTSSHTPTGSADNQFETEPNRDPVFQDQKVIPEVRDQQLLLRVVFSHSTFRNSCILQ